MKVKSKKPNKQRKRRYNVKHHEKSKLFTVRLDDIMMEEWGIRRIALRIDDEVRVIKGEMVGVEGKVLSMNKRTGKIEIEECTLEKKSGATYYIPISPSNIVLTKFGGKKLDPWRQKMIDRKQKLEAETPITTPEKKKEGK
ncbi:MAG: 50S ribosomal protein L24 [archaeon]|nr:50S ribosomal protein L24 [archaeon]